MRPSMGRRRCSLVRIARVGRVGGGMQLEELFERILWTGRRQQSGLPCICWCCQQQRIIQVTQTSGRVRKVIECCQAGPRVVRAHQKRLQRQVVVAIGERNIPSM
jgi:hypothetical protein